MEFTKLKTKGVQVLRGRFVPPQQKGEKGIGKRLFTTIFKFYPGLIILTGICVIFTAIVSSIPSIFMQNVFAVIEGAIKNDIPWSQAKGEIFKFIAILASLYIVSLISAFTYNQLLAVITQGVLAKLRKKMFNGMQNLPLKYFDTNNHGDIMSYYTNDIDTLRQMISQSFPNLLIAIVTLTTVVSIMLSYSFWMTLVVVVGVVAMTIVTKKISGGSSKYFIAQQKAVGKTEGFIEEMMNGQKVVKVFCHEEETKKDFDKINEELYEYSSKANQFANMLMPILNNIGNILYVFVAVCGGLLLAFKVPNVSFSMLPLSISIVVPFLNMTKQFSGNISQVSNQINAVIMGLAGAGRIFKLIDEAPEEDEGYVTLVNAKYDENGNIIETKERTGMWAWKHPHEADGTVTYTKLMGDVRFYDVDFGYNEEKTVLHKISLYAKPGQKVAFVGSTGAGKTTITNLINRFYDIKNGKIRYDGINIQKIKKSDLRRSLGIVLQETNLFTGTVMENIRYGRLEASDEECIEAAKLSGADDFITRLPKGYDTMLYNNGSNLSQGQRQLIAISRAAVADPPVMILDEATSSIDTRTELVVQAGMDALMKDRTVFVIAHRLSTVKNSNAIMVLENGEIIERGTHDELIEQKGTYYKLYTGAIELD